MVPRGKRNLPTSKCHSQLKSAGYDTVICHKAMEKSCTVTIHLCLSNKIQWIYTCIYDILTLWYRRFYNICDEVSNSHLILMLQIYFITRVLMLLLKALTWNKILYTKTSCLVWPNFTQINSYKSTASLNVIGMVPHQRSLWVAWYNFCHKYNCIEPF